MKVTVNFKIHDVTDWPTDNYNTLPNDSKGKVNQTMKFGQLIKFGIRNIFLQNSCKKCG